MKKIKKENPFKTPEDYFDSFEGKLMDKLNSESSIIPTTEGFKVPEGYFNTIETSIQNKLNKETKVIKLPSYRKYYIAAASIAAIAVLMLGSFWNKTEEVSFTDLASSDIEAYFETNTYGLSSYEMAEFIPLEDVEISDLIDNQFEDEYILEYLDDTLDDFEELNIDYNE